MHVLFASGIFPPQSGGPATFIPGIATEFVDRGHDVSVVTNGDPAPHVDDEFPFDVARIPTTGWEGFRFAKQIGTLVREIRRRDPGVVVSNAFDWQTALATKLTRRPFVTKIVGDMAWERTNVRYGLADDIETFNGSRYGPRVEAIRALRTIQTRAADHVVVPSSYLKDLVASWGIPRKRITVIHNAMDPEIGPDADSIDREDASVVTVCRLVDWKGVEGLADVTARLREDIPDATLRVVGDGPERESIERYAQSVLPDDAIEFHGRVPYDEVLRIVSEARVFALNSTYEGLPHVVLEAMACATPAVVSDAGGNPEVVADGETGFVVPQGDAAEFADRCCSLIHDDERWERLRTAGRRRLVEDFDYGDAWDQYEELLQAVADGSDPSIGQPSGHGRTSNTP